MEQGHTGYWYQDGTNAAHGNAEYTPFGEYNSMLENQASDMQYDAATGGYAGHSSQDHQMSAGHYDPNHFNAPNDSAATRQPNGYHDVSKQSAPHAYTQPPDGAAHQQSSAQHGQFNPAYQHHYDDAGQRQQQQQQQPRPLYDGQARGQSHASTSYQQGHAAAFAVPQQSQGQYNQQPTQHAIHPQYQQNAAQSVARTTASPNPNSARHPSVQYSAYPDPNASRPPAENATKPQAANPQQTQTTQFMPQYNGQNPNFSPAGGPAQLHSGKQSPAPVTQHSSYQNTHPGPYHPHGYQQTPSGPTNGASVSPAPYFHPYAPPQHAQPHDPATLAHRQQQMMAGTRAIAPNQMGLVGGTQVFSAVQPYGQTQPQPQPIIFHQVPNHPYLSVSSAPLRYRAKSVRPQAPFTPLEHTFKPEPRTKTKTGTKQKTSDAMGTEASSASESEADDDESELDQEAVKILAKMGVPKNTPEAVEQDVILRVWHDSAAAYDKDKTSKAIQWFGAYVDGLWVEVKRLKDSLKSAEENGDKDKIRSLQEASRRQNELMHTAIQTADKFGEDYLVSNMGGNRKLCTIMRNALANCFTSKDFTGPYPRVLLKLLSRFTTIDTEFLAKLKLDSLRSKYSEQISSEMKGHVDQVNKNARLRDEKTRASEPKRIPTATKLSSADPARKLPPPASAAAKPQLIKKEADMKKPITEVKKIDYSGLGSARKLPNSASKPVQNGSPAKRPHDNELESRTAKKVAVESNTGAPITKRPSGVPAASSGQPTQGSTAAAKPKPSATILPGKARTIVKPVVKRPEPAAPSAFSSISGLLAEIAKPKEVPKVREEPERKPETPEETARRLRKEKRRKLRVVWKPDDQLEEVRIFQHDAAEDEGRGTNMLRDARDNRSEGQMLKMGIQDDEDDAEDDGKPRETSLRDWVVPNGISFDQIGDAQRDKSFVSRGGVKDITSEQQKFMQDYESRELMAVYTTAAEIPETPRSPPSKALSEMDMTPKVAVLPSDTAKMQEVHRRWAEFGQYGAAASQQMALQRLGLGQSGASKSASDRTKSSSLSTPSYRLMTQAERDEAVLTMLRSDAVKTWQDPSPFDPANPKTQRRSDYPDPKVQAAADAIEALCEQYRGKPFPPTGPPEHITSAERSREWWAGHERDTAARAMKDAKDRAKALAEEQARNVAAAQAAQQSQAAAQAAALAAAAPAAGNDMAAWATYFAQAQTQAQYPQQAQAEDPAYAAILQQVQALQSGQQQPAQQPQPAVNDVQALLATLGGQVASVSQPQPADPSAAAWAAYYQNQAQAQVQAQPDPQAAWAAYYAQFGAQGQANGQEQSQSTNNQQQQGRQDQHQRFGDGNDRQDHFQRDRAARQQQQPRGGAAGAGGGVRDQKGINRALIGTKPCSFWAKGQCAKGDQCTFRHDPNDLK
ncbi:Zinc finger domain-containing protein [Microdochium nivale]|nr:Zinc finger domain-containing protein [Microdochium nivale]